MRSILAMLSASLLTLQAFTPAVAAQDRLTPAARAAATERLAGTPAARPAAWNQVMGAGDISADPDTATTADLATSELMLQPVPPQYSPPATTSILAESSRTSPTRTATPAPGDGWR